MAFLSYEEVKKNVCEEYYKKIRADEKVALDFVIAFAHSWGFERALERVRVNLQKLIVSLRGDNIISLDAYSELRHFVLGTILWEDDEEVEDV